MEKSNRFLNWYSKNYTKIAYWFIIVWCLLPAAMTIHCIGIGLDDNLIPIQVREYPRWGLASHYLVTIRPYLNMFHGIGIANIAFVLFNLICARKKIFNKENIKKNIWVFLLLILFVWSIFCAFTSGDFLYAFYGEFYLNDGLSSYFIYAAIFITALMIDDDEKRRKIIKTFGIVVVYLGLLLIIQEYGFKFFDKCFPSKRAIVFNQFNHFGYVLCTGLISFVGLYFYDDKANKTQKILYCVSMFIITAALLINDTFGSYLAVILASPFIYAFYILSGRKLTVKTFIPVFIFAGLSIINSLGLVPGFKTLGTNLGQFGTDLENIAEGNEAAARAGTGRFTLWKDTIERIFKSPVVGYGPEGLVGENAIHNGDSPHNEYLQIAAFMGIPGLLMYLSSLITLATHHFKNIKKLNPMVLVASGSLVVYLCSALFGNPVFNSYPYLWVFFGLTASYFETKPFIYYEENELNEMFAQKSDRKNVLILSGILMIAVAVCIVFVLNINLKTEKSNEIADIEALRIGENQALIQIKNDNIKPGTYYLDIDEYALVKQRPNSYGLGTKRNGKGLESYSNAITAEYDTSDDYRDKVVQVIINNDYSVEVAWIK